MKGLIPTAVAIWFVLTPVMARGEDAQIRQLRTELERGGVKLVLGSNCPPSTAAYYSIKGKSITVCRQAMKDRELILEAITHEVVHAAQHCAGRELDSQQLIPLGTFAHITKQKESLEMLSAISADGFNHKRMDVRSSMAASTAPDKTISLLLEAEAYGLEAIPILAMEFFRALCK